MKSHNKGRKPRSGICRRVQIRLSESSTEIFDRYSDTERNEIFDRALREIFPRSHQVKASSVLIRPQKTVTETICRVDISNQWVRLLLPEKRDDFRDLVKKFRYQWEGSWCRQFSQSVDICDRAAEICNELLIAGFCIQVANDKVKDRIIAQSFTPEQFKLISKCVSGAYSGQFSFAYPKSESDRWYKEINKLNGCRYADGVLYVPSEQFEEVEDFAECNDFGFSEGALSLISKAKALKESAIIFTPTRKQRKKKNELTRTDSIPAHLRDDGDD